MSIADITAKVPALAEMQETLYKHLHENPELSMVETETRALIAGKLTEYGYDVKEIGGGVVGVLANGQGRTVLFRADIDALPVQEATGLDYASTKVMKDQDGIEQPVMHACGHDMHVVAGLGAAQLLAEHKDTWSGTYIALFQPAEETAQGAQSMVDAGLIDAIPKPDVCLGQHVLAAPVAGKVAVASGPILSTAVSAKVTVYGKGSHGSMPHLGVDPVLLASSIVMRLQSVVAREIAPSDFGVITIGALQAGQKANIIPDRAELRINFRAYSEDIRDQLVEAMERIVKAECEASRSPREPEFEYSDRYPLTDNDEQAALTVTEALREGLGAERVEHMPPVTASEDFSNIPRAFDVPYVYWGFGGYTEGSPVYPNHNPSFAPAIQPTLTTGTEAAVSAVLGFLRKA
ncbi:amidohydrolase [Dermatophilus congolensis]|uniref:amidohydrolase n=1 Tax=Dermatophilus congolensis TaxID=1863 RepID=UPI00312C77B5